MPTTLSPAATRAVHNHLTHRRAWISVSLFLLAVLISPVAALSQVNGLGNRPYLGWSTYSQQTIVPSSTVMNEQNILAQSDAIRSSGLGAHGFQYINLDAAWNGGNDQYGRTLWSPTDFPAIGGRDACF